jgi:hypothetical protein
MTKTQTICKNKTDKKNIENYRPIANLCSVSKVFEKQILKCIQEIQTENTSDITGENQRGLKQKRSISSREISMQREGDVTACAAVNQL